MIERWVLAILLLHLSAPIAAAQESARPSEFALTFCVYEKANIRSEPSTAGGESTIIRTAERGEPLIVVDGKLVSSPLVGETISFGMNSAMAPTCIRIL